MASIRAPAEDSPLSVAALDVLRGLAVVLMIVNHVSVQLGSPAALQEGPLAVLAFVGSFAPVLFFFSTGFGIGLGRPRVTAAALLSTLSKAGLLILADEFMWWRQGVPWGLDFLAFIGISSIVVTLISARSHALKISVGLIACDLAIRFGYGHWSHATVGTASIWQWVVGTRALPNVSYPLSPWIVFPLLGFVFGRTYRLPRVGVMVSILRWAGVAAVASLLSAWLLEQRGSIFFRWGTVSFGYLELSLGVVLASMLFAWKINGWWPWAARAIALRGVASLAVVPFHYAIIGLFVANGLQHLPVAASLMTIVAVLVASIAVSRSFAGSVAHGMGILSHPIPLFVLLIFAMALAWIMAPGSLASLGVFVAGQLLVACLLDVGNRRRAANRTRDVDALSQAGPLSVRDS